MAAVGVYFWMQDDSKDNRFDDPLIQGDMGLGSTFTYDVVEYKYNGTATTYTGSDPTMTIVGESGSYYLLSTDMSSFYSPIAMIKKDTGEVRFSSPAGTDSIIYGGDEISLEKWEFIAIDDDDTEYSSYRCFIFSSNPENAIPYKISIKDEYSSGGGYSYSSEWKLELVSYVKEDHADYTPSDKLGNGFVYSVSGTEDGVKLTGEYVFLYAADGVGGAGFIMTSVDLKSGSEKEKSIRFSDVSSTEDIIDYVGSTLAYGIITSTDTISTIDGKILCDVYTYTYSGTTVTTYACQNNGIVYLYKVTDDTDNAEMKLTRHLSR